MDKLLKKTLVVTTTLGILSASFLINSGTVFAQEATESSKTTQKLKERIERIVEEKREQIKGIISNLDAQKQGFVGEVQRISEEAITVKTNKATRIISIDESVTIMRGNTEIELSDVAVENWAVVMGVLEEDAFRAVRILASTESLRPDPHDITLGSISEITRNTVSLIPRSENENAETVEISFNNNTVFEDINGNELERTITTDIEEQTQALVVSLDDEGDLIAKRIRFLTTFNE